MPTDVIVARGSISDHTIFFDHTTKYSNQANVITVTLPFAMHSNTSLYHQKLYTQLAYPENQDPYSRPRRQPSSRSRMGSDGASKHRPGSGDGTLTTKHIFPNTTRATRQPSAVLLREGACRRNHTRSAGSRMAAPPAKLRRPQGRNHRWRKCWRLRLTSDGR